MAVLAAGLTYTFTKCIGIELLQKLYELSLKINDNIMNNNKSEYKQYLKCDISFVLGDILEYNYDYENMSILFANCKTFSKDLMTMIAEKLVNVPVGVILITSAQDFSEFDSRWEVLDKVRRVMTWGNANLYIHIKIK